MDDARHDSDFARALPPAAADLELDTATMRRMTDACTRFVLDHIATLGEQPSWDLDGAADLAREFREPIPERGRPLEGLLARLGPAFTKSFNTAGPGYLAYIPGGGIYPAALADYVALGLNRYVGVWTAAPVLVTIEQQAVDWIRELVGFPAGARGLVTSGGSLSNLIALVTARRNVLGDDFGNATIYYSEETHHSIPKAALLAGFSERSLRVLPCDERFRLRVDALRAAVREDRAGGRRPFLVVASAGTTNTGAIDPLEEIAAFCEHEGLWLHADGAYGGLFRLAPGGAALLAGMERADSLSLDPHKGLFLPYGTGVLLVREPEALRRAHAFGAGYLQDLHLEPGAVHFSDISPELSRDFRGLRLWLPLQLYGVAAFRDNLREKLDLARWAWEELQRTPGFECTDEPQLSVVAFRYRPTRGDADEFNARLLQRVNEYRRVYLSSTMLRGRFTLRICVLSFRSHGEIVAAAVEDLRRAARELEAG